MHIDLAHANYRNINKSEEIYFDSRQNKTLLAQAHRIRKHSPSSRNSIGYHSHFSHANEQQKLESRVWKVIDKYKIYTPGLFVCDSTDANSKFYCVAFS